MDTIEIDSERLVAGERYLDAIEHLGLMPQALFWAYDDANRAFLLVLVTSIVDYAGPLGLSEKLFLAHQAGATPTAIDPFSLRLHSPKQAFPRALRQMLLHKNWLGDDGRQAAFNGRGYPSHDHENGSIMFSVEGLNLRPEWIYVFRDGERQRPDLSHQWKRLSANIDALVLGRQQSMIIHSH